LNILEINICSDHVHAIIVCEEEELSTLVGKWKGRSAFTYNRRVNPLVEEKPAMFADGTKEKFWAKSFHPVLIENDEQMQNTINYIKNNRYKHQLPVATDGLTRQLSAMRCTKEHAFRDEYKGGFDVVIGNPPYVRVQQIDYNTTDFLKKHYKTALKRIDISLCFIELSKKLIKKDIGTTSFITSNQFLTTEYGQAMRAFLLNDYNLTECVDFGDLPVFADALTYVSIFTFKKSNIRTIKYSHIDSIPNALTNNFGLPRIIDIEQLTEANWNLKNFAASYIWDKIFINCKEISTIGNAWYGIITGADPIFIFTKNQFQNSEIEKELFIPLLRAQNCSKYYCFETEKYVLYPYKFEDGKTSILTEEELQQKFPKAYQYLISHRFELERRKDSRDTFEGRPDWYCLTRYGQLNVFNKVKIITPGEVKDHKFCIDFSKAGFSGARVFAITIDNDLFDIKYVLCILNSALMKSFLQSFSSLKSGGYYSYSSNILNKAPIKNITLIEQQVFIELVDKIFGITAELHKKRIKFLNRLTSNFENINLTSTLENFVESDFKNFLKELSKQKLELTLIQQDEWEDYFSTYKSEIVKLKSEIEKIDKEIDQMVYELYGLSEEEIGIVEESV
jgi:REP element-mobilizing transposase RayT